MNIAAITPATLPNLPNNIAGGVSQDAGADAPGASFAAMVDSALRGVSAAQDNAASAEQNYASGVPGASLGQAVVSSDRAEIAWNAMVAVRNEAVSAYASVMNMQF